GRGWVGWGGRPEPAPTGSGRVGHWEGGDPVDPSGAADRRLTTPGNQARMAAIDRPFRTRTARRPSAVAAVAVGIAALLLGFSPSAAFADSVRRDQWQIRELDARSAWTLSGGDGVTVAVIDSGVDATHPDLIGQVLPGADFVDGTTDG